MTKDAKWTVTVEQDPNSEDLLLPLPQDLLDLQGWKEGDTLIWAEGRDGVWILRKQDE